MQILSLPFRKCLWPLWLLPGIHLAAQPRWDLTYYLPPEPYQATVPTPEAVLGFSVGEWHLSHDQVVQYCQALAQASDRVSMETYGRTYEGRPQVLLTITHPDNHGRLEEIRQAHLALSDPASNQSPEGQPVVVYLGFSVHGNEASGGNASVLLAYYLAAGTSDEVEALLRNAVILIDPVFNPDGFQRFSTWVNANRSLTENPDPATREFREPWPGGRTNHYWFDLNRDWLPAQLPELRNRLPVYHRWLPNVLTDHHEMSTNATFFFQPGIPSRNHPLTPNATYRLTEQLARFHARHLDSLGSLYYTEEDFDDFYFGKGSTYPDLTGGVGILFEQASSRGHAQKSRRGVLRFPFAIRNQVTVARSTLEGAVALREQLLEHQRQFYRSALEEARQDPVQAYAFGGTDPGAHARARELAALLQLHRIEVFSTSDRALEGVPAGTFTYLVPTRQPQYRLVTAMFERRKAFTDSLFYDISAWTLPLAFGLVSNSLDARTLAGLRRLPVEKLGTPTPAGIPPEPAYAYAIDWRTPQAPALAFQLLRKGLVLHVATHPLKTAEGFLPAGTLLLPRGQQPVSPTEVQKTLAELLSRHPARIWPLATGYNPEGLELGSPSVQPLRLPSVALLVGEGVSAYDAGELWHLLDQRLFMPLTLLDLGAIAQSDLGHYTHLLMAGGSYTDLGEAGEKALAEWVRRGGTLVAMTTAASELVRMKLGGFVLKEPPKPTYGDSSYAAADAQKGARVLGGAIFETVVDTTHPLAFGLGRSRTAVFRDHTLALELGDNPFSTPLRYTSSPLMAGYCHPDVLALLQGTAAVQVSREGQGRIVLLADNPVFRAFWRGTEQLLVNALFFSGIIRLDTAE